MPAETPTVIDGVAQWFYMKSGWSSGGNSMARMVRMRSIHHCGKGSKLCFCPRFVCDKGATVLEF